MNRDFFGMPPMSFAITVGVLVYSLAMIAANCIYGGSNLLSQAVYGFTAGADITLLALHYQAVKLSAAARAQAQAEEALRALRPPTPWQSAEDLQKMLENSAQGRDKPTRH
jgi:hypothetical protein